MAKMVSPAGEMQVKMLSISATKDQMVISARFGAWDSQVYFSVDEVSHLIRLMLNSSVILYLLRFPFIYMSRHFFS